MINFWLLSKVFKAIRNILQKVHGFKISIWSWFIELNEEEKEIIKNSRKGSHAVKSIHLIKIHKNAQITSTKSDRVEKK